MVQNNVITRRVERCVVNRAVIVNRVISRYSVNTVYHIYILYIPESAQLLTQLLT